MKRALKYLLAMLAVAFVGAQFYRPAKTNPPVNPAHALQAHVQQIVVLRAHDVFAGEIRLLR